MGVKKAACLAALVFSSPGIWAVVFDLPGGPEVTSRLGCLGEYEGGVVPPSPYDGSFLIPAGDWVPLVLEELTPEEAVQQRFGIQVVTIRGGGYQETRFVRFQEWTVGPPRAHMGQVMREERASVPNLPRLELELPRQYFVGAGGYLPAASGLMGHDEAIDLVARLVGLVDQSGLASAIPTLESLLQRAVDSGGVRWVPDILKVENPAEHTTNGEDAGDSPGGSARALPTAVIDAIKFFVYDGNRPTLACQDLGVWALYKEDIPEELIPTYERLQDELLALLEAVAANDLIPIPNHNAPSKPASS